MQWLSYINFLCAAIYAFMTFYILVRNPRSWLNRSCAALMLSLGVWGFFSTFVHNTNISLAQALRMGDFQAIGWSAFGFAYLWFVLNLTEQKNIYTSRWFYFFGIFLILSNIYLQWSGQLVQGYKLVYYGWSVIWNMQPIAYIFYLSYPAQIFIAFYFLLRYREQTMDVLKRKRILMLMVSTIVPIILGSITNIVLPMLDIRFIPDIAELFGLIWAVAIVYDISKNRLMTITPAMAADNIIAAMAEGLMISDNQGRVVTANNTFCSLLRYENGELNGKEISLFLNIGQYVKSASSEAYSGKSHECVLTAKNGDLVPVLLSVSPLRDGTNTVKGIVCMATDIRERKKEEDILRVAHTELEKRVEERTAQLRSMSESLAQESERLRITLQSIADAVIVTDINGAIILMNESAQKLTGYQDIESRLIYDVFMLIDQKTRMVLDNPVKTVLVKNQPATIPDTALLVAKDGKEIAIADSAAPIQDDTGRLLGAVLVFRDITDKKRIEEEMLKALKLESLGVLSGGLAHDFNNILTGILTNVSFVKTLTDKNSDQYQLLVDAEYAALRAKDLTHQLLTFAKGGAPIKKLASMKDILHDTTNFVLSGSVCRAEMDIVDNLWNAEVDAGQISQVLQNLLINAMQAMPKGGTISIHAANMNINSADQFSLDPGKYIRIVVADTGTGIDPRYLPNIFDPYFTTKAKGSGLGLATSYSIVKKHKGRIDVSSALGRGTEFTIYIPAEDKPVEVSQHHDNIQPASFSARVLVMDDEEIILNTAKNSLATVGCSVDFAVNGAEALLKYKQAMDAGSPYDVVILDLIIPGGMGGKETVEQLLKIDSKVKAIVSSGYSNDTVLSNFASYGFKGVVPKPYTMQDLIQAVYKVVKSIK